MLEDLYSDAIREILNEFHLPLNESIIQSIPDEEERNGWLRYFNYREKVLHGSTPIWGICSCCVEELTLRSRWIGQYIPLLLESRGVLKRYSLRDVFPEQLTDKNVGELPVFVQKHINPLQESSVREWLLGNIAGHLDTADTATNGEEELKRLKMAFVGVSAHMNPPVVSAHHSKYGMYKFMSRVVNKDQQRLEAFKEKYSSEPKISSALEQAGRDPQFNRTIEHLKNLISTEFCPEFDFNRFYRLNNFGLRCNQLLAVWQDEASVGFGLEVSEAYKDGVKGLLRDTSTREGVTLASRGEGQREYFIQTVLPEYIDLWNCEIQSLKALR